MLELARLYFLWLGIPNILFGIPAVLLLLHQSPLNGENTFDKGPFICPFGLDFPRTVAMINIHPIKIPGKWREGFVLDYHTVSSTYLGDNPFGYPVFDTKYTEVGELLYRLKSKSDSSVLSELVAAIIGFVKSWDPGTDLIVPVPPSRSRAKQPVMLMAEKISEGLGIPLGSGCVCRVKKIPELKNIYEYDARLRLLADAHTVDRSLVTDKTVLLFDDLYRSGATMNAITETLYQQGCARDVYALAVTRTRSRL